MYYTVAYTVTLLINFILFRLFTISVENSVDPVAFGRNQLSDQDLVFSKTDSTGQGLVLGSAGQR